MGFVDRPIPTMVSPVGAEVDGFQHQLYELPSAISALEVRRAVGSMRLWS